MKEWRSLAAGADRANTPLAERAGHPLHRPYKNARGPRRAGLAPPRTGLLGYLQQPSSQQHPPQHEPQSVQHAHGQHPPAAGALAEAAPRPASEAVINETTPRKRAIVDSFATKFVSHGRHGRGVRAGMAAGNKPVVTKLRVRRAVSARAR